MPFAINLIVECSTVQKVNFQLLLTLETEQTNLRVISLQKCNLDQSKLQTNFYQSCCPSFQSCTAFIYIYIYIYIQNRSACHNRSGFQCDFLLTKKHVGNQSNYVMLAYHSLITTTMASNKEGKSMLNSTHVIYLIYSNEECMLRIMGYIGRWTAALSRTYPASYTGASSLDSGSF